VISAAAKKTRRRGRTSGLIRYLIGFYLVLIAYVSLTPFSGWHTPADAPLSFLWQSWPKYVTRFDLAINFIAYIPLGFLLFSYWSSRAQARDAILASILCGAALSITMEALQRFLDDRIASNLDVLVNCAGCASGALISAWLTRYTTLEASLTRWRREFLFPGLTVDIGLVLFRCGRRNRSELWRRLRCHTAFGNPVRAGNRAEFLRAGPVGNNIDAPTQPRDRCGPGAYRHCILS
jgi:VanZ family protein